MYAMKIGFILLNGGPSKIVPRRSDDKAKVQRKRSLRILE